MKRLWEAPAQQARGDCFLAKLPRSSHRTTSRKGAPESASPLLGSGQGSAQSHSPRVFCSGAASRQQASVQGVPRGGDSSTSTSVPSAFPEMPHPLVLRDTLFIHVK